MPILFASGAPIAVAAVIGLLIYLGIIAFHLLANFGKVADYVEPFLQAFFGGLFEGKPLPVATTLAFAVCYYNSGDVINSLFGALMVFIVVGFALYAR